MPPGEQLTERQQDLARNTADDAAQRPATADRELLQRTAAGNLFAFETFMDRHETAVARFARSLTENDAAYEEALQETFINAWRGAAGFRGAGSARCWLLGIARNAVTRQFRRRSGEPEDHEELTALGTQAGWGDEGASVVPCLENRERVEVGLRDLSAADREVLILRDLEGFTSAEVADLLELGLEAVRSRLHRARLRFVANVARDTHESP